MGDLLGNAVRFGVADDVLAAGEGIETMLSLRCPLPSMPMVSALSANHLAAIVFPLGLRRLYIVRDDDAAGEAAVAILLQRAEDAGIEAIPLSPRLGDFNEDLHIFGLDVLRAALRIQLAPEDVDRFLLSSTPDFWRRHQHIVLDRLVRSVQTYNSQQPRWQLPSTHFPLLRMVRLSLQLPRND
jgi:hypothetical protein